MSKLLRIVLIPIVFSVLSACTVVPPQVAYTGPRVEVVTVHRVPYYPGPPPYYAAPPHRHGHYRHWYRD